MKIKSYLFIFCVCLVLPLSCSKKECAVEKSQTDWELNELQGHVQMVAENTVNMLTDQLTTKEIYFDTIGMYAARRFFESGELVRQIIYTDTLRCQVDSAGLVEWITFVTRDSNDRIIEEYSQSAMGEWTTAYNYNSLGLITMETTLTVEGDFVSATNYTYNADNRLTQQIEVATDGQISALTNYQYSPSGMLELVDQVDAEGEPIQQQVFTYDSHNNLIEEKYVNASGLVFYACVNKYANNQLVERKCTGTNIYNQTYTYTYQDGHRATEMIVETDVQDGEQVVLIKTMRTCDDRGNWINEIIYEADDNGVLIPTLNSNRIIEYYD